MYFLYFLSFCWVFFSWDILILHQIYIAEHFLRPYKGLRNLCWETAENLLRLYGAFSETIRSLPETIRSLSETLRSLFWDFTESFLRLYGVFSETLRSLFWDFTESFLRFCGIFLRLYGVFFETLRSPFWETLWRQKQKVTETSLSLHWAEFYFLLSIFNVVYWALMCTETWLSFFENFFAFTESKLSINVYWDLTEFSWEFLCIYWV